MLTFTVGNWNIGRLDDACPSCGSGLPKRPGRKIDCAFCGQPIFVRKRPLDGQRVLLSAAEATVLERQWQLVWIGMQVDAKLQAEDVVPSMAGHVEDNHLGLYRNALLVLAQIADRDRLWCEAFHGYLRVCYIDANGPCNGPERFNPSQAWPAPAVINRVAVLWRWFDFEEEDVLPAFASVAEELRVKVRAPLRVEDGWAWTTKHVLER